jgi:hypothetical protein
MTTSRLHAVAFASLAAAVLAAAACGASNRPKATPTGQGRLAVALVDAPVPQVSQVVVNVTKVTAHHETEGWLTITPPGVSDATPLAVDLLTLQAPAQPLDLGLANLPPGQVSQLRLYVTQGGNYVLRSADGVRVPLKVPSGPQSGIKVKGPWQIVACSQTSLVIDFDAKKSIWFHPAQQGDEWILRPVIRTRSATTEPVGCDTGCSDTTPCPEGQSCTAEHQCVTDTPPPGPAGSACQADQQCLSGECDELHRCARGGAGTPCQIDDDCVSATCDEGSCTVPPDARAAGEPCLVNSECLSNACDPATATCARGGQGAACGASSDCVDGMTCSAGTCGMP